MRRLAPVLFLAAVLLGACGGESDGGEPPIVVRTPTSVVTATDGATPTAETQETTAPGETPSVEAPTPTATTPRNGTADPTPTVDNSILVACGDRLAPLDKQHRVSADCGPSGLVTLPAAYSYGEGQLLVSDAADAMIRFIDAAASEGIFIYVTSSYRSYDQQVSTYNWHVNTYGQAHADRVSARPGHSEHQLGTTADVVSASAGYELDNFPGTPEAAWVEANATRFGFVVSYPAGREATTGYAYEPWHVRYVGEDIARAVEQSGLTLGEYLR